MRAKLKLNLEQLTVDGPRARATRRLASGATESVDFAKRKGVWYILLIARRR